MSWYVEFIAPNKQVAKAEFEKRMAVYSQLNAAAIALSVCAAIDALPDPAANGAVYVKSQGHYDSSGGQSTLELALKPAGFVVGVVGAPLGPPTG